MGSIDFSGLKYVFLFAIIGVAAVGALVGTGAVILGYHLFMALSIYMGAR